MGAPELVYWRGSSDVRTDLLGLLTTQGYATRVVSSLEEVLAQRPPNLMIVDASAGEAEASMRVVELSGASVLKNIPILFISYHASNRSAVLKRQFASFIGIDVPFKTAALLEKLFQFCPPPALKEAFEESERPEEAPDPIAEPQVGSEEAPGAVVSAPSQLIDSSSATKPGKSSGTLYRAKIVRNLDPANLVSSYGGELLATGNELERFDDAVLIGQGEKRQMLIEAIDLFTRTDPWIALHSRRVAFIAAALANILGFGKARDMNVRTVGMLLGWGFRDRYRNLATRDAFLDGDENAIRLFGDPLRLSAAYVKDVVQDDLAARTINVIADIVSEREITEQTEVIQDAECTLVTELADRACWGTGSWDPFGAHRTIRKLRIGVPVRVESAVVDGISRVLCEAGGVRQSMGNVFIPEGVDVEWENKKVDEAVEEAERLFPGEKRVTVQYSDLKPGMKLVRPVVSWDGRLILPANIELDEEMIYRIWQLSVIRPLRPPVAVLGGGA